MSTNASIQYLGGLEPSGYKLIQKALEEFKFKIRLKEGNDVVVHEFHVKGASGSENKLLAHRYKVAIYLGDEKVTWPVNHGEYLTQNGVIALLRNLAPVWNLLKNYRVKKAIEQKKKISHLNKVAAVSEAELAKW